MIIKDRRTIIGMSEDNSKEEQVESTTESLLETVSDAEVNS